MITVVSGLPRSGTSMMMMMLEAGGMEILTDNKRKADKNNPKGYYEFEKAKRLKNDDLWIGLAENRAIKIISHLLFYLPSDKNYNIIFMRRRMGEILSSQKRMLNASRSGENSVSDRDMGILLSKHLVEIRTWLNDQDNMDLQYVSYNDVIKAPIEHARIVNRFLGNKLNVERMANVVSQSLYRQRGKTL